MRTFLETYFFFSPFQASASTQKLINWTAHNSSSQGGKTVQRLRFYSSIYLKLVDLNKNFQRNRESVSDVHVNFRFTAVQTPTCFSSKAGVFQLLQKHLCRRRCHNLSHAQHHLLCKHLHYSGIPLPQLTGTNRQGSRSGQQFTVKSYHCVKFHNTSLRACVCGGGGLGL